MSRQTTLPGREGEPRREGGRLRYWATAMLEWGPQWAGEIMSWEDQLKLSPRVPRWGTTLWPILLHQTTRKLNEHIHLFLLPALFHLTQTGGSAYVNAHSLYQLKGGFPNIFTSRNPPIRHALDHKHPLLPPHTPPTSQSCHPSWVNERLVKKELKSNKKNWV